MTSYTKAEIKRMTKELKAKSYDKGMRICEKCGKDIVNDTCMDCDTKAGYIKKGYIMCEKCGNMNKEETDESYYIIEGCGVYNDGIEECVESLSTSHPCKSCGHELLTDKEKESRTKRYVRKMGDLGNVIFNQQNTIEGLEKRNGILREKLRKSIKFNRKLCGLEGYEKMKGGD